MAARAQNKGIFVDYTDFWFKSLFLRNLASNLSDANTSADTPKLPKVPLIGYLGLLLNSSEKNTKKTQKNREFSK